MYNKNNLVSKLEIRISCRDLADEDVLSKFSTMAVLFQKINCNFREVARTEKIQNNLNPMFKTKFVVHYRFEELQLYKVSICNYDRNPVKLSDHDFLGSFEFSLGQIVSCKILEAKLKESVSATEQKSTVIISCEELSHRKNEITFWCSGKNLDKKDIFGLSDPYLAIYRCNDNLKFRQGRSDLDFNSKNFTVVYQSNPIYNTLNPSWPQFTIDLDHLCNGDKDRLTKIACLDWDRIGSPDFIGHFYTTVNEILASRGKRNYSLINPKKAMKKANYSDSGKIQINVLRLDYNYSFIDYVTGGMDLNFNVAIDFTSSNGRRKEPKSLHYIPNNDDEIYFNPYQFAITSIGNIIQDYDSEKMFPAFGFGARIPPKYEFSDCFPINFHSDNPSCYGVDGLIEAYRSALAAVVLYSPSNLAPIIRQVQRFAEACQDGSKYFVLLIITDGTSADFDATVEAIIDCSYLPMSIIIVGVGNGKFSVMESLNCENGKLRYKNKISDREIVQFVVLRDVVNSKTGMDHVALSKAVLYKLPSQVCCWMSRRNIKPLLSKPIPLDKNLVDRDLQKEVVPTYQIM